MFYITANVVPAFMGIGAGRAFQNLTIRIALLNFEL